MKSNFKQVYERAVEALLNSMKPEGFWQGEFSPGVLTTCFCVQIMMEHTEKKHNMTKALNWLEAIQNPDGGWGYTNGEPSDLDHTVIVNYTLRKYKKNVSEETIRKAEEFINKKGGIDRTRLLAKVPLALSGEYPWEKIEFTVEEAAACLCNLETPEGTLHVFEIPKIASIFFGLPPFFQQFLISVAPVLTEFKVVLQIVSLLKLVRLIDLKGKKKRYTMLLTRQLRFFQENQRENGSWNPWTAANAALMLCFIRIRKLYGDFFDFSFMDRTITWLESIQKEDGSWSNYIGLPVMDTAWVVIALCHCPEDERIKKAVKMGWNYLKRTRNTDGGWGLMKDVFSDVDDTALSTYALSFARDRTLLIPGIQLLQKVQNADGGWTTWGKGEMSTEDNTTHALFALSQVRDVYPKAVEKGIHYLKKTQQPDGSWLGRWISSRTITTAHAVFALAKCGLNVNSPLIQKGIKWLKDAQNTDGGWGPYKNTPSTADSTATACITLQELNMDDETLIRGLTWLQEAQRNGNWEPSLVLTDPPVFYSDELYPLYFAVFAFGLYFSKNEE